MLRIYASFAIGLLLSATFVQQDEPKFLRELKNPEQASLTELLSYWYQMNEQVWLPRNAQLSLEMNYLSRIASETIPGFERDIKRLGKAKSLVKWQRQMESVKRGQEYISKHAETTHAQLTAKFSKPLADAELKLIANYIQAISQGTDEQTKDFFEKQEAYRDQLYDQHRKLSDQYTKGPDKQLQKLEAHQKRFQEVAAPLFAETVQLESGATFKRESFSAHFPWGKIVAKYVDDQDRSVSVDFTAYTRLRGTAGKFKGKYGIVRKGNAALTVVLNKQRFQLDAYVNQGVLAEGTLSELVDKSTNLERFDSMKLR